MSKRNISKAIRKNISNTKQKEAGETGYEKYSDWNELSGWVD